MVCASLSRNQSFVDYVSQIGRSVEKKIHITLLLRELLHSLDKYFKDDLKTPLTLAVRLAFLVSTPFASQSSISYGYANSDKFTARIHPKTIGKLLTRPSPTSA